MKGMLAAVLVAASSLGVAHAAEPVLHPAEGLPPGMPVAADVAPSETGAVETAIADAFRKADQTACSGDEGFGCTVAETALGTALFEEREQDRANQFLRER